MQAWWVHTDELGVSYYFNHEAIDFIRHGRPYVGADMKVVVASPFESGGFSGLLAIFLHPFDPSLFLLSVKRKDGAGRATFMSVFPPHFQPAESIRVNPGPRIK